jgi:RNA polymerase sigma-70 factor, ECF subfamily
MTSGERDDILLDAVRRGEAGAFGPLVARHRHKLFLRILCIVQNHDDAEDVLQETLIRAYRGAARFRGDAGFYTWLYRIATNCALEMLSRRKRLIPERPSSVPDDLEIGWLAPAWDDPEQVLCGVQMVAAVGAALDAMLPEFRTAILLREIDGLSYHEIADAMLCPVGTVKSRISSARSAIATKLRSNGFPAVGHVSEV